MLQVWGQELSYLFICRELHDIAFLAAEMFGYKLIDAAA